MQSIGSTASRPNQNIGLVRLRKVDWFVLAFFVQYPRTVIRAMFLIRIKFPSIIKYPSLNDRLYDTYVAVMVAASNAPYK